MYKFVLRFFCGNMPINFLKTTLMYLFFPPVCPICKEIVDEYDELCETCASEILCTDLDPNPPLPITEVMRLTKYRDGTRKLLRKLKFDNNTVVLKPIKKILERFSTNINVKNFLKNIDAAVFVPLHAERLRRRGYNQTELIFVDWLASMNVPTKNILIRTKKTPHLFNLSPKERKQILDGAFKVIEGADVAGKNILIVDDIFTTGATSAECAKVLKKIGAAQIFVLAFASDFGEQFNA